MFRLMFQYITCLGQTNKHINAGILSPFSHDLILDWLREENIRTGVMRGLLCAPNSAQGITAQSETLCKSYSLVTEPSLIKVMKLTLLQQLIPLCCIANVSSLQQIMRFLIFEVF